MIMKPKDALRALAVAIEPDLRTMGWERIRGDFAFRCPTAGAFLVIVGVPSRWALEETGGIEVNFDIGLVAQADTLDGRNSRRLSRAMGPSSARREWVRMRDAMVGAAQERGRALDVRILGDTRRENFYSDVWLWLNEPADVATWSPVLLAGIAEARRRLSTDDGGP